MKRKKSAYQGDKRPRQGLIGSGSRLVAILGRDPEGDNGDYIQDSCGCVFCDLGLDPIDGEHNFPSKGISEPCGLLKAPQ